MPRFVLSTWQVNSLLHYGGLPEPGPGSPLRALIPSKRPLAPGDPDFQPLIDQALLRDDGRGDWRTNFALLPFLGAAVQPDEVLSLGVGNPAEPGFTVARRNDVLVDATLGQGGITKLEFPLTRSAVVLTIISALSGNRPEPESTGFRFVGGAAEAFVLAAALRARRLDPALLTVDHLRRAVATDLQVTALAAPFAVGGAPDAINRLVNDPAAVNAAIQSLIDAGQLRAVLDHLEPAEDVLEVLGGEAFAVMGVGRTEVIDGQAKSTSVTATRIGERILSFRVRSRPGRDNEFEWMEVTRQQLRWLALAVLLPRDELERLERGATVEEVTAPSEPAAPAEAAEPIEQPASVASEPAAPIEQPASVAPEPAAPIEQPSTPVWVPTHTVGERGLAAYERPDPEIQPVATLDPWLPVEVDEWRGAWAHAVCSNGWTCWVDGRALIATR